AEGPPEVLHSRGPHRRILGDGVLVGGHAGAPGGAEAEVVEAGPQFAVDRLVVVEDRKLHAVEAHLLELRDLGEKLGGRLPSPEEEVHADFHFQYFSRKGLRNRWAFSVTSHASGQKQRSMVNQS